MVSASDVAKCAVVTLKEALAGTDWSTADLTRECNDNGERGKHSRVQK